MTSDSARSAISAYSEALDRVRHRVTLRQLGKNGDRDRMLPDPTDNELASYDGFRVDVFAGGRLGVIARATTYTPLVQNYSGYPRGAEQYFQDLWESAESLQSFLEQLQQAADSANTKIDYESNWLAMYEFGLDAEDQTLKTVEIERTKEVLRGQGRWGKIRRYLDVGMCTGRYPIQLREAIVLDGKIVAIDEDCDYFRFADTNRERLRPNDQRIKMMLGDFGANQLQFDGPFDLITCMLDTLSHFDWRHQGDTLKPFDDLLQRVLARMTSLLTDESQPEVRLDFTVCMQAGEKATTPDSGAASTARPCRGCFRARARP